VYAALYDEKDLFSERHQFFLQLIPTAKNRPPLPVGLKYWDELSAAWQKNYLGQGQPADLLKAVKDRVNGDLQRFCPVTAPTSSFGNVEGSPAASPMASPSS
jgi:multiple sugar transport system substrate-binding protein